ARTLLPSPTLFRSGHSVHRRDGRRATERAAAWVAAERDRDAPREARHRIPRGIERRHLDGGADRHARDGRRRLYREGELCRRAWDDVERGTRRGSEAIGARRERVARTSFVQAHEEGGDPTHR